jgi:hypothetical protein
LEQSAPEVQEKRKKEKLVLSSNEASSLFITRNGQEYLKLNRTKTATAVVDLLKQHSTKIRESVM